MNTTPNLSLPYILPSQAQKAVTHNEALQRLDALVMLAVKSRDATEPPPTAVEGDRYIVAAGASAAWNGLDGQVAAYQDGTWVYLNPREGWVAWCVSESKLVYFAGGIWSAADALNLDTVAHLGINAAADPVIRLAVASASTLLSHDGSDHRLVVNKAGSGDTASLVFQDNFSGRAEIGLAGDDAFSLRVSSDGEAFETAMKVDSATGRATFPATNLLEGFALNLYSDAGRFSSDAAGGLFVGAFSWPAYLSLDNGATASGRGKFVYDNADYGGAGDFLQADVKQLVDQIREPQFRRHNIEFWVAMVTVGSGTTSSPLTVGPMSGYLSMYTSFLVRPPALTFHIYVKALDDTLLIGVADGQRVSKNGISSDAAISVAPADGWVSLTIHDKIDPRLSYGYQPTIFRIYAQTSGDRYLIACPALMGGITRIDDDAGIVAAATAWTA